MPQNEAPSLTVGVVNPFALAEMIQKRGVNWKALADPHAFLESTLGVPYEQLFDPKFDSPLYPGLAMAEPAGVGVVGRQAEVQVRPKAAAMLKTLMEVGTGAVWLDPGDFFHEATELTDPVQGAVANCYFIAALSAIAWARPYVIAQRNRAVGPGQQDFMDMIEFHKGTAATMVEVSERLPLNPPLNGFIYARSSEPGEIWPAVYEKAFAKWKTNDTSDTPDILKTAYGDPVGALVALTGLTPYYFDTANTAAFDIWQTIRANSISMKTFNPMVAWTYGTAPSPDVNYANAHLVANHAYSIHGWQYANNKQYIVLRNPWGTYEATLNIDGGTWVAWDAPYYGGPGWWRPIAMGTNDGIFALEAETFKKYFAGYGLVK